MLPEPASETSKKELAEASTIGYDIPLLYLALSGGRLALSAPSQAGGPTLAVYSSKANNIISYQSHSFDIVHVEANAGDANEVTIQYSILSSQSYDGGRR